MKIKKIISMLIIAVLMIGLMASCTDKLKDFEATILERKSELSEGEMLMVGYADFSQTDMFAVSFILSEDKNSIKNIKTHYINIEYQNLLGSSSSTGGQSYYDSYAILNGEIDVILKNVMFENGRLILTFDGDTASGTIEYSKSSINININDSGNKVETQSDYFGIQPIDFTVK